MPTWSADGETFTAPGCRRLSGERAAVSCGAAVAVNLPRLALRAGPWREDRVLEGLSDLLATVAGTPGRAARLPAVDPAPRATTSCAAASATPWSPSACARRCSASGDGEIRPEQGARLLGMMGDALRRLSEQTRLALVLSPFFGERARARFAEADAGLPQHAQRLLFDEGVGAGWEPGRPYGSGYRLSPCPGFVPWAAEAELLRTVASGALHPLPEDSARRDVLSLAESWTRFERLHSEPLEEEAGRDWLVPRAVPHPRPVRRDRPRPDPRIPDRLDPHAPETTGAVRIQVLRRPHRARLRERADRHRGSERLRQEQRGGRRALGARRSSGRRRCAAARWPT